MKKENLLKKLFTPSVVISLSVLLFVLFGVIFAGVLAPYDPDALDMNNLLKLPSAEHLLGTDKTGRDILSRLLFGGRTSLPGALGVVSISVLLGVPIGLVSGYYGGRFDAVLMRICDVIVSFPSLLLAFVFVATFGRGLGNAVLALGIVYIPMIAKLTRSLVLVEKNKTYVEAARSVGFSDGRILLREILPNCVSTMLVELTLDLGYAIIDLATMSFLGLGVQPPTSDWGAMLEEGRIYLTTNPLCAVAPGLMIIAVVIALNVFSDGIQSCLDPSKRKLPGIKKFRRKQMRAAAKAAREKRAVL